MSLTPTAIASLDSVAQELYLSRSELMEQIAKRFHEVEFLGECDKSKIEVMWIECDRFSAIAKIERELLTQFHQLTFALKSK